MPSQSFSGRSKEDLVVVARLSGLLSDEQAQRMTRPALARFLEKAQAEAEQAAQRQAAGAGGQTDTVDTPSSILPRKPAGRRRKADAQADSQPELTAIIAESAPAVPAAPIASAVSAPAAPITSAEPVPVESPAPVFDAFAETPAPAPTGKPAPRSRRTSARTVAADEAKTNAAPSAAASDIATPSPEAYAADARSTEIPEAAAPIIATPASEAAAMPAAPVSPLNLDANEAAVPASAAAMPAERPAVRPTRRVGARKGARQMEAAPFLANQQIPVEFQPADAAAPAAAAPVSNFEATGFPVAEPAELNALEPVEPTAAQAAAVTAQTERSSTTGTAAHEEAAVMLPAAEILNERPHKRPGRPPKKMTVAPPAPAPAPVFAPALAPVPAPTAAPAAPDRIRTGRSFGPTVGEAGRQPARSDAFQSAAQPHVQHARPDDSSRPQSRNAFSPGDRMSGQDQSYNRHDRHVHLPGGHAAHHSIIPAHHTLTPPATSPDAQDGEMGNVRADDRQGTASSRQESFQERPSAGPGGQFATTSASVGPADIGRVQGQGQGLGQAGPQRGQMYNASGKAVRPAEEGYAEIGEPFAEGDIQPAGQPGQSRFEGDAGKSRRAFVETGEMVSGVLEIMPDGYGFLRKDNYLQGAKDIYVPPQYIRRFNLRQGDLVVGPGKVQRETDRYQALLYIKEVNGLPPERMIRRPNFDKLTPIYPDERFILETNRNELSTRIIDLVAPIGKGQRGMIVSPPKAGKTILLQKIANAISINNPDVKLIVLLIDERPEEVTDMQRSINGEVVFSTFDKTPENHVKVTELVLERAMRLVELDQDVVILLDSITRMGRAYNLTINPTGRTLSGGLDPGALYGPKRFFGAARNIEGGGSLTIIATALIDTGSRMDEVIFEEFKGTGNMEVYLDRKMSEKRIFPAIDINRSGTRREELLLTTKELDAVWSIRKAFSQLDTSSVTEMIINLLMKTNNNQHFVSSINVSLNDKNVFEAMRGTRPGQTQNGHASKPET